MIIPRVQVEEVITEGQYLATMLVDANNLAELKKVESLIEKFTDSVNESFGVSDELFPDEKHNDLSLTLYIALDWKKKSLAPENAGNTAPQHLFERFLSDYEHYLLSGYWLLFAEEDGPLELEIGPERAEDCRVTLKIPKTPEWGGLYYFDLYEALASFNIPDGRYEIIDEEKIKDHFSYIIVQNNNSRYLIIESYAPLKDEMEIIKVCAENGLKCGNPFQIRTKQSYQTEVNDIYYRMFAL